MKLKCDFDFILLKFLKKKNIPKKIKLIKKKSNKETEKCFLLQFNKGVFKINEKLPHFVVKCTLSRCYSHYFAFILTIQTLKENIY